MTNETNKKPSKPSHIAYIVRETTPEESYWTRIGAAWAHGDGQGFNIQVDATPLSGRITLRVATEKKA